MAGPAFLVGDRVTLNTLEEEDVVFVRDGVNDPRVWKSVGGQTTPTNLATESRFFEQANRDEGVVQFVVVDGEERIGVVELDPIEWDRRRAEVAIWILPDHQDAGYGRDALSTLAAYAFDQLDLHKLTAEAFATNEASLRMLESLGFEREGRLREEEYIDGAWVDVIRFGLLADERDAE